MLKESTSAFTQADWDQPPILLRDPDTGKKIKLQLRRMSFAREVSELPSDLLKVHKLLIEQRANRNAAIYIMVAAWNKLARHDEYYKAFKFRSESEYLAYYGLPDGTTLAGWTVMVELFDKPTFVLLGDEVLGFMMRTVAQNQSDTDERKKDYQAIFDKYCSTYDSFDKSVFYVIMKRHVQEKYEEARERERVRTSSAATGSRPKATGFSKERVVVEAPTAQKYGPTVSRDFDWQERQCPACQAKDKIIGAYDRYTAVPEDIILKFNPKLLPQRPKIIHKD